KTQKSHRRMTDFDPIADIRSALVDHLGSAWGNICMDKSSARQASLKSQRRSIERLFIISRNSGMVLFGERYVSRIVWLTCSALPMTFGEDRARILLTFA